MRTAKPLTIKQCDSIKTAGSHPVGGVVGLYMVIKGEARGWAYRFTNPATGKRTWYSIGRASEIGLSEARDEARRLAALVRSGVNPSEDRKGKKEDRKAVPFESVFSDWIETRRKNGRYRDNLTGEYTTRLLIEKHIMPTLRGKDIRHITARDVAKCLMPSWSSQKGLFGKLRSDVSSIFRHAKALGIIDADPSDMRGDCGTLLRETGKKDQRTRNWGALLPEEAPEFVREMQGLEQTILVKAFLFAVLTCTRSSNVRLLRWRDIDLQAGRCVINLDRMKTKRDGLVVMLSRQAAQILESMDKRRPGDFVFSDKPSAPARKFYFYLPVEALNRRREAAGKPIWIDKVQTEKFGEPIAVTQHGISRATFKTWSKSFGNWKRFNPDAVEMCLGHKTDSYNGAYDRAKLEDEKREVLQAWADFIMPS